MEPLNRKTQTHIQNIVVDNSSQKAKKISILSVKLISMYPQFHENHLLHNELGKVNTLHCKNMLEKFSNFRVVTPQFAHYQTTTFALILT